LAPIGSIFAVGGVAGLALVEAAVVADIALTDVAKAPETAVGWNAHALTVLWGDIAANRALLFSLWTLSIHEEWLVF
jgi:hypothetical protein